MMDFVSERKNAKPILSIVILAFSLRLLFFFFNRNYTYTYYYGEKIPEEAEYFRNMIPPFDSQEFLTLAENLSTQHRFTWARLPNTFRTPLYPTFIALLGRFSLHPLFSNLLASFDKKDSGRIPLFLFFQILLGTATVLLIFYIGKSLFGKKGGIISAFLLAVDIPNILFNSLVMSETLLLFFLVLGTFLLFRNQFFLSGITFSLAALTKPIALYVFLPIFLFLLFTKRVKSAINFLIAFSLLTFIWMARNYRYYKTFAFTSIDGYNLLYHNLPALEMKLRDIPFYDAKEEVWRTVRDKMNGENAFFLSQIAAQYAKNRILHHLPCYAFIHLKGMFLPLLGIKSDDLVLRLIRHKEKNGKVRQSLIDATLPPFLKWLIFLLGGWEIIIVLVGFLLFTISLWEREIRPHLLLLFLLMLYFLFIASPLPDGRFRLPSLPFLYLGTASFFRRRGFLLSQLFEVLGKGFRKNVSTFTAGKKEEIISFSRGKHGP